MTRPGLSVYTSFLFTLLIKLNVVSITSPTTQHAWTNATPNLPGLDEIEEWEQDAEVNTLDVDDNDDTIITPNNDQAPPDDDDDDHVEDFLGFI
ncbi:hypothetical protein [Absidia glauca]|uniref:Secreted protein n=1 Tax=Absidia glauca TaxID=4829 RepID=A0A168KXI9_ABSGL|nr:hypothetical protein [Absidia glauca]